MTVFPAQPNLSEPDENGFSTLLEPHLTFIKLGLGVSLKVYIREGFKTDGATVPKEALESSKFIEYACKLISKHFPGKNHKETLSYLIGTPFEMPRLLAAIVHDALYGMKWRWRWLCDRVYRRILIAIGYDRVRLGIEYFGIRLIGGKSWKEVTDLERDRTRRIVSIEFSLARDIGKDVERIG